MQASIKSGFGLQNRRLYLGVSDYGKKNSAFPGIETRLPMSKRAGCFGFRISSASMGAKASVFGSSTKYRSVRAQASGLPSSQIASSAFTLGTVAVLPFYTFMVAAPEAKLTKKMIASSIPYIILGLLYAYLLYMSWTPDTIRLMFASKYWLPELTGIAKMFSNEMTLASAWIHLLAVDLFAARQVYYDGLKNNVEMRHSVSLCLLFCPLGILVHFITRAFTASRKKREHGDTSG